MKLHLQFSTFSLGKPSDGGARFLIASPFLLGSFLEACLRVAWETVEEDLAACFDWHDAGSVQGKDLLWLEVDDSSRKLDVRGIPNRAGAQGKNSKGKQVLLGLARFLTGGFVDAICYVCFPKLSAILASRWAYVYLPLFTRQCCLIKLLHHSLFDPFLQCL